MASTNSLNDFLDFTDLKRQRSHSKSSFAQLTNQDTFDNENLLRSFKELRQKLKASQKENAQLKEQAKINVIRVRQNQQALQLALTSNIELKDQLEREADVNMELKNRFSSMKEQLQRNSALEEQLAYTKQALLETKLKEKSQNSQQKKYMELFLRERMEMEEELSKLRAKVSSDQQFMTHLEEQASRSKQQNIRLQNHLRKLSITYEQNSFNQKFQKDNFEVNHLNETISQLQKQIVSLKGKLQKQKQRRYLLQEQLIHLQESAGINNVKAITYEGQTQMLSKKQDKMVKKIQDLSNKLERLSLQKIAVEEQAIKYQMVSQEVITKLKPLLSQDMLDILAYYEEKLKNTAYAQQQVDVEQPAQTVKTPPSILQEKMDRINQRFPLHQQSYFNMYNPTPHKTTPSINSYRSAGKPESTPNTTRFTFGQQKQNELEHAVLEGKIRREREEMQKKLKEKWFQKKIDCSMPTELYKLRAEYINTFIDR